MAKYTYTALNRSGQKVTGTIDADVQSDVYTLLQRDNLYPISIKEGVAATKKDAKLEFNFKKKISSEDIYLSCKQFYTMLHSGISILEALSTVSDQTKNKYFATILKNVEQKVATGTPFSKALQEYKDDLPSLYIAMIETGEVTGNLEIVMMRLATYYENDAKTAGQVKSAMIYPCVLAILTVVMVFFMMIFIMPTFAEMFEGSGTELPAATQVMMNLSDFLVNFWWLVVAIVIGVVVGFKQLMKIPKFVVEFDKLQLKLPIVKFVVITGVTFRVCRSLAIMLSSGVSLYEGLSICEKVAGNEVGRIAVETCRNQISEGISFGTAVTRQPIFPSMMTAMVKIGEQAGVLDGILDDIADYYQEELNTAIRNLVAIMEPMMIIVMAIGIGSVVIAMLLPMFTMMDTVS
jgi:type IV pilus assembly protein PilC